MPTLVKAPRRLADAAAVLACTFVSTALAEAPATNSQDQPPNIVLIVADDLGYGELGCYGQQLIKTPRIDALAEEGVRFTQFYAGAPVCAPSRCVLMTGKSPARAAIRDNGEAPELAYLAEEFGWEFPGQRPIPAEEITIAEALGSRGYATAAIGKWGLGHFGTTGDPNVQGFDLFFGYNCQRHAHNHYPSFLWRNREKIRYPGNDGQGLTGATFAQDEFTREALQFIRDHRQGPFFLYLPVTISHLSIQVPSQSLAQYEGVLEETPYPHHGYLQHPAPHAGYAAMISHLDRDVGKIVDLIDELGLAASTIILFTSDNGPTYDRLGGSDSEFFESTAGLRGRKGSVYEGGLRVPLVVRWTGRTPRGAESDLPCAFWDVMPTLCEAASVATTPDASGLSLLPTICASGSQPVHDHLVWEFAGYGGQQAIRRGDWKGVRRNTRRGKGKLELYDLATDAGETRNVAAEHPGIVRELDRILAADRTESTVYPLFPKSNR